jgi:hypothetical protein
MLDGSTLTGAGTVGPEDTRMLSGSTLAPGEGDVGELTFTTKLQMQAGAALEWELGPSTNDVVNASATEVEFGGAWTLRIRNAGGRPHAATPYVLLTYDTLTGFDPADVTIDYGNLKWMGAEVWNDSGNKRLVVTGLRAPPEGATILIR